MTGTNHQIALLATGDEIVQGDITNTNAVYIAHHFHQHDIPVGMHLTVSDNQADIVDALTFLTTRHRAIITIGGLGPTSDDRTRFALAEYLQQELIFDSNSWQQIVSRLQQLKLPIPKSNRQQCLFPKQATIIENRNGTANACYIKHHKKDLFMLPGPPNEMRPLFNANVLPYFLNNNYVETLFRKNLLLFGTSEGKIAAKLDPLVDNSNCEIGYRVDYPYLEIKLKSSNEKSLEKKFQEIKEALPDEIIFEGREIASQQLFNYLKNHQTKIYIDDHATYGALTMKLLTPATFDKIVLSPNNKVDYQISVHGLKAFWQNDDSSDQIPFQLKINQHSIDLSVPYRGYKTLAYATETICSHLLKIMTTEQ